MLSHFRTYQLAVQFHRECQSGKLPGYLKNQLLRASSSVALNLAEGSGKPTMKDQVRFYFIALGSIRECQAALDLASKPIPKLAGIAHELGGGVYRLCHPKGQI